MSGSPRNSKVENERAESSKATGLSSMIGASLTGLHGLNPALVLLVVVLVTQFITEFTSNVAIANLILPVLANMARTLDMDPRYLMIPATLACSMAFHMPVGTPPNAIVAGVAHIPTSKMAIGGIGPKIITTLIIWGAYPTWGSLIFKPEDIAALETTTKAVPAPTIAAQNLAIDCNVSPSALHAVRTFNCTIPSEGTIPVDVLKGSVSCNYLPSNKS